VSRASRYSPSPFHYRDSKHLETTCYESQKGTLGLHRNQIRRHLITTDFFRNLYKMCSAIESSDRFLLTRRSRNQRRRVQGQRREPASRPGISDQGQEQFRSAAPGTVCRRGASREKVAHVTVRRLGLGEGR